MRAASQHLRCERDDLHVVAVAQLTGYGAEDARTARVSLVVDQDSGVLVEANVAAIRPAELLRGAHHDGTDHVALLDGGVGDGLLDRRDDHVADPGRRLLRAPKDADAFDRPRAGVVRDAQPGGGLDHSAPSGAASAAGASPAASSAPCSRPGWAAMWIASSVASSSTASVSVAPPWSPARATTRTSRQRLVADSG